MFRLKAVGVLTLLALGACAHTTQSSGGRSNNRAEATNDTSGPIRDELAVPPEQLGMTGWTREGNGLRHDDHSELFATRYHLGPQMAGAPIIKHAIMLLASIHDAWESQNMTHRSAESAEVTLSNPRKASFVCTVGVGQTQRAFACVWALGTTQWLMTVEFYANNAEDEASFLTRANKVVDAVQQVVGAWESAPRLN